MKPIEHYMELTAGLKCESGEKAEEISVNEIAEILYCTPRNAKLILAKLEDLQWITWRRGRGRGNKSEIRFLKAPCELLLETAKNDTKEGKIDRAKYFLEAYQHSCPGALSSYKDWLERVFGFQTESEGSKQKDVLRLMTAMEPEHFKRLDPCRIYLRSESHIVKQVCDTLIRFNEEEGGFMPHLAHHWECDDDQKTWTFYLRKGIYFHDGTALTAEDVKYSFERFMLDDVNKCKWLTEDIENVAVRDEHSLDICLKATNSLFLHHLCDERLSILNRHQNDGLLIGTGPFRLARRDDRILMLEAHERYFKGRAFLDRIELWYMDGDVSSVDYGFYMEKEEQNRVWDKWHEERNVQYLSLNANKSGPLGYKAFRKALRQIISPSDMVDELAGQRTAPVGGFLNRDLPPESGDDIGKLLAEGHYKGDPLLLYTYSEPDHREDASWIQKRCRRYGIALEVCYMKADELMKEEVIAKADLIHDSATFSRSEEMSWLHLFLTENSFLHVHLPEEWQRKSALMRDELRFIDDHSKRISLLCEADSALAEDVYAIPLYQNNIRVKAGEAIQGIALNEEGWIDFYGIWYKKEALL
ncbi:SgrR family transcriptional regulator [Bacillus haynesii]|uniref:SgrR family transcriptional regulator n=1 Tax=Bacillus haynesii TaxID=1925021 RepID=UPI001F415EB3|nr:SgrR family transcriptional regulator [Bacillus haynesii]UIN47253.1 SgrR family transcriptional regulator [Bacillus licheniformis]MCY7845481.1 SgrR family transcriptional regulator [Bacillus haynesii]MCY8015305.1 SgrR family transcriptional regulator [Bacillus haynesii]MCY8548930.1 SgrR family transcriptional regulator [Bacillus haynesii]MCY8571526.1 SgrR family transcriptional regulator [Bacillus haynesii]